LGQPGRRVGPRKVSVEQSARSFIKVGRKFNVSVNAVSKHAAKFGWEERISKIDAEARRQTDGRVIRARSDRIDDTLELVSLARDQLLEELRTGNGDVRLGDIPALVKLEALLEGEPTERVSLQEAQAVYLEVLRVTRVTVIAALDELVSEDEKQAALAYFDKALSRAIEKTVAGLLDGDDSP
jgi:hypothetical protein